MFIILYIVFVYKLYYYTCDNISDTIINIYIIKK